ncbi:MAG: T9SS type A sorting domain-containing protein [Bacteroidales bacterium]|nr:T9SS type A sorting domain-containing protein [Bacteroidales bacterium]
MSRKNYLIIGLFVMFATTAQSQIQHPTAWLRADSATLGAPSWKDVSGNGLDATPSADSMPAAFSRMNFNKCFEVGGTETFTLPLGINDSRQSDVIVVYETYDTTYENALWQVQLDTAKRIGQTTRRILNDNGQITYDTANRLNPVINYLAQSWRTPEVCAPTLTLCAADSLPLYGRIAEALYFDRRIGDTAVIQWISYLAVKYGVTLAQTDYLDSRRNVIWDYTNHPDYSASIAGVGRDDSTGLCQKQTYFADNRMIIAMVEANNYSSLQTGNNEDNPASIADGDFIIFGMDGVLPAVSEIYTQDGVTYEVVGRSMAQMTGNAHTYGTFILLDTTAVETQNFASQQTPPVLLIDRSGTGDFPTGETEQVQASGMDSLGHYIYNDIHWDTDRNGRDFFCFAVTMPDTTDTPKALAVDGESNGKCGMENGKLERDGTLCQANGCNKESLSIAHSKLQIESSPLQIAHYKLHPNPNHGNFTVEIIYPEAQDVFVTVYDTDGKVLLKMDGKGQSSYRFAGRVQTAGHYLIDIASGTGRKTLKMVVN